MFFDRATIKVRSGRGGDGCVSFQRLKFEPKGGPDGGHGGRGGSVYLRADPQLTTLYDFQHKPVFAAPNGKPGRGDNKTGRSGEDLYVNVPCGTEVWVHPRSRFFGDLTAPSQTLPVAKGGKGGRGNKSFATSVNQTPREAEKGSPGEELELDLELKLIADVGLVGLPNAGKSTLLRSLSKARPRVASYPFTTLYPHLGICELDPARRLVLADIPGLIAGAHRGAGLGHEFLRHIERTKTLAHLVSAEDSGLDRLVSSWETVEEELRLHSPLLAGKRKIGVLTKLDLLPPEEGENLTREFSLRLKNCEVTGICALSGQGIKELTEALWKGVKEIEGTVH